MIISDSLPVQWYPAELPTFNEKVEIGVFGLPFFQKFNREDVFSVQLLHTASVVITLDVLDQDEAVLYTANLTEVSAGVYFHSFIFEDEGILEAYVSARLVIASVTISRTDQLDVRASHDESRWIAYTNSSDFAFLIYSGVAPPTFGIRVDSKFYEERNPEENESEDLGDGSIEKLSGSVKIQRLLEIEPLPPHMHRKMKLIMKHNSIFVSNVSWLSEDGYEIGKSLSKSYPFYLASCVLTMKDSGYITNVY